MKPNKTWILIANSKSARIVENIGPGKGLSDVNGKSYKAQSSPEHADQEGRSFNTGSGARHKLEAHHGEDPVLRDYISTISDSLNQSFATGEFNRLILCTAPATLGAMRSYLPDNLQDLIIAEVPKDLTQVATNDLPPHFEDYLAV